MKKRGEPNGINELIDFGQTLEAASIQTVSAGVMIKDIAQISDLPKKKS